MNFTGRTVIVTGGTGALGNALTKRFAELGAHVAIPSRSIHSDDHNPQRSGEGAKPMVMKADMRNQNDAAAFVREVAQKFGTVDVLVNAAGGYSGGKRTEEMTASDVMDMLHLNTISAFNACSSVIPFMKQASYGRIVSVAALTAIHPQSGAGAYAMSKRALITLTETIAVENRRTGITANAVAPAVIDTEANRRAMPGADYSKWVTAQQVTDVILFLASESSSAISGNVIMMP